MPARLQKNPDEIPCIACQVLKFSLEKKFRRATLGRDLALQG